MGYKLLYKNIILQNKYNNKFNLNTNNNNNI